MTNSASATQAPSSKGARRALISSFLGSTVEYYDFLLYGSAAGLVFPYLFFSDQMDPALGMALSFVILLAGYITRPIGGILFGHFGDKFGRKNMLFITLMMMGLVSVCIGLMPTFDAIGVAAPLILVALRVVQGLAVGGEWAGATLMAAEHVPEKNRGLAASIAVSGGPTGSVLATLVLGLFAGLPQEQFLSWGWRIPFLLSAALVVIGLYMRYRVAESPDFVAAKANNQISTGVPILRVVKKYPLSSLYGIIAGAGPLFLQSLIAIFMVPYVVKTGVVTQQEALIMLTVSSFIHIFTIPFFANLSDRFGRRPVMLAGAVLSIVLIFPMFALYNSGNFWLIALAFLLGNPIIQASMYGPIGAFLAEKFETQDRYTGVSLTYQLGSLVGAGTAPLMATWLINIDNGGGTNNIAWYFIGLMVLAGIAVYLSQETRHRAKRTASSPETASNDTSVKH